MAVNIIIPIVHTSEKVCGRNKNIKKTAVYIGFSKLCTAAMHVDTVNNIHDFRQQLHILAHSIKE